MRAGSGRFDPKRIRSPDDPSPRGGTADASDLKSDDQQWSCGFDSHRGHLRMPGSACFQGTRRRALSPAVTATKRHRLSANPTPRSNAFNRQPSGRYQFPAGHPPTVGLYLRSWTFLWFRRKSAMKTYLLLPGAFLALGAFCLPAHAAEKVDFSKQVRPIFAETCYKC